MKNKINELFSLDNKVIVVTGAAGLLGKKHIEAIAAYGGHPILLDLSQSNVDALSKDLNNKFAVNAKGFSLDITDEAQVKLVASKIHDDYGKIDGLVNNAANNPKVESDINQNFSRLENFKIEQWEQDIAVGLTGAYLCSKHFGKKISENNDGGSIVNISSDLGLISPDQRLYQKEGIPLNQQNVKPITYSVVKSGLIGLTRYMATYWADNKVRCNVICPGGVSDGQDKNFLEKVTTRIPLKRLADPNEYQGTLVWMLSDASSYLNGAVIPVDGGRTAW